MHEGASPVPPWRIGVDVGGTFTDAVLMDACGAIWPHKVLSDSANPAAAVLAALAGLGERLRLPLEHLLARCERFVHGTTVATNVLLERKGAKVGLLTTEGFRDTLEIRRGHRENMWDHRTPWRDVLVPRRLRLPVRERVGADGRVVEHLAPESVRHAIEVFRHAEVEAVAVCLLHAYANPEHERACRDLIRDALPAAYVSLSSDVAPIVGEFERTSTAVANAYIAPRVLPYLRDLARALRRRGLGAELLLIQSNGGAATLDQLLTRPIALALSGPAAGAASLRFYAALLDTRDLIAIEVGGTSCDVTVMNEGRVEEAEALRVDETLIALPSVEIHTVGTGGGTICGVDAGGLLFAGPEGAGARPGPACYGRGGTRPTVTDAQLVLGRLRPGRYAGGALTLDRGLAEAAIRRAIAEPLAISVAAAARGMIRLAEQQIRQAIEKVSLERGLDPRRFVLVGGGGAGPLHVASVARQLGCRVAFVPKLAGVMCAFGMCNSRLRYDAVRAMGVVLDAASAPAAARAAERLADEARAGLAAGMSQEPAAACALFYDLRYVGQSWTVPVEGEAGPRDLDAIRAAFEAAYRRQYAIVQPEADLELVNIRAAAFSSSSAVALPSLTPERGAAPAATTRLVDVDDKRGPIEIPALDGAALRPGHSCDGPAIIEERTTTILIGHGDRVEVDRAGNYVIHVGAEMDAR